IKIHYLSQGKDLLNKGWIAQRQKSLFILQQLRDQMLDALHDSA
ncbi:11264_t:CDS:1, partial [Dentiscutata erythropus]